MALKKLVFALTAFAAASPLSAAAPEPTPTTIPADETPGTQYCLRVGPYTGTRLESVQCWTRLEWADQCIDDGWTSQCVDVDKEWAENGVRIQMKE